MCKFVISVTNYQGCPVFDIGASGKDIYAVEIASERGLFGDRNVYTFEVKDEAELKLTIKKLRGDVDIDLPPGWDISTNVIPFNDFCSRIPKVCIHQNGNDLLLGYVATQFLTVHFFRAHSSVQVEFGE